MYDIKIKGVQLIEEGMMKVEKVFGIDNLFDVKYVVFNYYINQFLKVYVVMQKDVDYVVEDGQVVIVDFFMGCLMKGCCYSEGFY